jgi:hypothetical protein
LYTDYLLISFGAATATGLSAMVEGEVSHDRITRFLSGQDFTSKDLWRLVKPVVRLVENKDGVLIFDDTIQEKAWTDENELSAGIMTMSVAAMCGESIFSMRCTTRTEHRFQWRLNW